MRIALIADARSPHTRGWVEQVLDLGHDVLLMSSHHLERDTPWVDSRLRLEVVPVGLARIKHRAGGVANSGTGQELKARAGALATSQVQARLLRLGRGAAERLLLPFRPEVVHALRLPFEGMFAQGLDIGSVPFALSTWGNDFTLHARASRANARLTRRAISRANGIHVDCERDLRESLDWGGGMADVRMVAPANGGLPFAQVKESALHETASRWGIPVDRDRVVLNPRGLRPYVCMDAYIQAVAELARQRPSVVFVFADASPALRALVQTAGIGEHCRMVPRIPPTEMRALYSLAGLIVSPTTHDGTPITLIEAMWSGAVPIAGDIPSIREWIVSGENGTLVDARSPLQLGRAVADALDDPAWRAAAARRNRTLVEDRAGREATRARVSDFYDRVAASTPRAS